MIFSEIYGEYFNAVAKILDTAVRGELNENDINCQAGKVNMRLTCVGCGDNIIIEKGVTEMTVRLIIS